jgi:hypothetical protein
MRVTLAYTNADGKYLVPRLRDFPLGLSARLSRFSLVVYRKDYVAYRHDRIFGSQRRRTSFSQLYNQVRLARWSAELSHARHLLFVGGGDALLSATTWEAALAAAELSGEAPPVTALSDVSKQRPRATRPRASLAARLLTVDDVRSLTGFGGTFQVSRLGVENDATDTLHLRAIDQSERYDVALRLWRRKDGEVENKLDEVQRALPGSQEHPGDKRIGDRSFSVTQGEILAIGLMHRLSNSVVLLTCGRSQCRKETQLQQLAKTVYQRLSDLPAFTARPKGDSP